MNPEQSLNNIPQAVLEDTMEAQGNKIVSETFSLISRPFTERELQASLDRVTKLYASIPKIWERYADQQIPSSYEKSKAITERIMAESGIRRTSAKGKARTIEAIILDSVADYELSAAGGLRMVERLFRETQQNYLKESRINQLIAEGVITGSPQRIQSTLSKELQAAIGEGKVLIAGTKKYKANTYAELVARTRTREAQSEAAINTIQEFGQDLIQISSHGTDTDICKEYEGKIFSLTGSTRGYPILTDSPPYHPNCTLPDTEVYTDSGWKKMKDITIKDKCWSIDPLTLKPKFVKIKKLVQSDNDEVVTFENKFTKLTVTADHRMFYQTDWNSKYNPDRWGFVPASELVGKKSGRFYRGVSWDGGDDVGIDYATLVGWVMAEGYVSHKEKRVTIAQSKSANFDKWQSISHLLDRMKIKHLKYENSFICRDLYDEFSDMKLQPERTIPDSIMNANKECVSAFLNSFYLGDGTIHPGRKFKDYIFKPQRHFFTSSKKMADQLCELIAKSGARPSVHITSKKGTISNHRNGTYASNHDVYSIAECSQLYASLQNMTIKSHIIPGQKYCVDLVENNTLWVKDEKGGVLWIGNCKHVIIPYIEAA